MVIIAILIAILYGIALGFAWFAILLGCVKCLRSLLQ